MFKFTRAGVNLISLGISTIIFCLIQLFIYQYTNGIQMNVDIGQKIMKERSQPVENTVTNEQNDIWKLKIEKIGLEAEISEGTEKETLEKYIGHFVETQKEKGNIGLAGHNRGYKINYFQNLKLLEKGDEIVYTYNNYTNTYEVTKIKIIKDTEWEYLENTEENMLTLITCVENEPEYRRCIQAIEKEKEENY